MKNRKRILACLLALTMMTGLFSGCGHTEQTRTESELFHGDPEALRVFVRVNTTYADTLVEQFPDIKFDFYYYGGLNTSMAINQLLEKDDFGDICFTSLQVTDEIAGDHLLDLSGSEICTRYEPSILSQFDVDGGIYQLPTFLNMRNIIYNKDMFAKHGWKVPETFGELEALCRRIREETEGITPIVMGGAADGYYFTTMTTYAQAEFLYTPEGKKWMQDYQSGRAGAEEGFGEGIRMTQALIDAGAFDYEANVDLWDIDLFRERMETEEAAMMFCWGGQPAIAKQIEENEDMEFGFIPFRNQAGQAFIGTNIPHYIGLAKSLDEHGNEKKLEKAMRVLDWLSTAEGLAAISSEASSAIYPLRGVDNPTVMKLNQEFWNENLDAIKAPMLYAGYEDILAPVAEKIIAAVNGSGDLDGLAADIDDIHGKFLKGGAAAIEAGEFERDFTHAETVQMMAHVLQSKGDSDITLVSDGTWKNGVLNTGGVFLQFYAGPILLDQTTIYVPGAQASLHAVQMTLTGRQVKDLLENGSHRIKREGNTQYAYHLESAPDMVAEASFDYFWAGMQAEWENGKVTALTLDDGRELADDQTCTVTFAAGDYTDELAALVGTVELPYTANDAFREYLEKHSPVSPVPVLR